MKVLIAGGTGFLGSALMKLLNSAGHQVWILTRRRSKHPNEIEWDGKTMGVWADRISDMDAVVNLTGFGLEHWPWTRSQKQKFLDSRVLPGHALVTAINLAKQRPGVFLQISGINYYGARGDEVADEDTPAADDYLAKLAVEWESAVRPIEELGVRFLVARSAVVLDSSGGLFPLMALPVRLCVGGPFGKGTQGVPWIHLADHTGAIRFLLENKDLHGVFNLISPTPISNADFMLAIAKVLHRPYWFRAPALLLKVVLGEMSTLILEGRYTRPKRLLEYGYQFRFPEFDLALKDIFS